MKQPISSRVGTALPALAAASILSGASSLFTGTTSAGVEHELTFFPDSAARPYCSLAGAENDGVRSVVIADLDGDGQDEMAFGARQAASSMDGLTYAESGKVYIVQGGLEAYEGEQVIPDLPLEVRQWLLDSSGAHAGQQLRVLPTPSGAQPLAVTAPRLDDNILENYGGVFRIEDRAGGTHSLRTDSSASFSVYESYAKTGNWLDAGDLDADGTTDLVIGVPGLGLGAGAAYLFFDQANSWNGNQVLEETSPGGPQPDIIFRSDQDRASLGAFVAILPDIDGDGFEDLVVAAAPGDTGPDEYVSRILLFYGREDWSEVSLEQPDATFWEPRLASYQQTDVRVANAGDLDGDAFPDLAIGSTDVPRRADGEPSGAVWILFGAGARWEGMIELGEALEQASFPWVKIEGKADDGAFGKAIEAIGNFDADPEGVDDLAVGAPDTGGGENGRVWLVLGDRTRWHDALEDGFYLDVDDIDGFSFGGHQEQLGLQLLGQVDVDGDKVLDLLATGPEYEGPEGAASGRVVVMYGGIGQTTDLDGDGYFERDEVRCVVRESDCDDLDGTVYPGAVELYDGLDNDCDGDRDEFLDEEDDDGDGFSDADLDCDDADATVYPYAVEVPYDGIDQDCQGGDLVDVDGDGWGAVEAGGEDCDDEDQAIHPEAEDVPYDGIDQDCTGTDRIDLDEDGYESEASGGPDCDDEDPLVNPGMVEFADDVDNDCDGLVDNGMDTRDDDEDSYAESDGDCADRDGSIYPGAAEIPCDGKDQDCDGTDLTDYDGDGYDCGQAAAGGEPLDCDDERADVYPGAQEELYDGVDQDCDGEDLDDWDGDGAAGGLDGTDCLDLDPTVYPGADEIRYDGIDQDCDGYDVTDFDRDSFDAEAASGLDCNDEDPAIHPGASEGFDQDLDGVLEGDGLDNDCDGIVDEGTDAYDDDGDGYSEREGDCDDRPQELAPDAAYVHPNAGENGDRPPGIGDGLDNDCDGLVDEEMADLDVDGDGFTRGSSQAQDCDDTDPSVYPGAPDEPDDGLDADCDGNIEAGVNPDGPVAEQTGDCDDAGGGEAAGDQGDGTDDPSSGCVGSADDDTDGDGYVAEAAGGDDCDDSNPAIYPEADEDPPPYRGVGDGLDNDCDDLVDEGTLHFDDDGDRYCEVAPCVDETRDGGDCDDSDPLVGPGMPEGRPDGTGRMIPDGVDNNCDGTKDEHTVAFDDDGDCYCELAPCVASTEEGCEEITGGDCDDSDPLVYSGALERRNGKDDDCDLRVDERTVAPGCRVDSTPMPRSSGINGALWGLMLVATSFFRRRAPKEARDGGWPVAGTKGETRK